MENIVILRKSRNLNRSQPSALLFAPSPSQQQQQQQQPRVVVLSFLLESFYDRVCTDGLMLTTQYRQLMTRLLHCGVLLRILLQPSLVYAGTEFRIVRVPSSRPYSSNVTYDPGIVQYFPEKGSSFHPFPADPFP